jgi:hypothetical protein
MDIYHLVNFSSFTVCQRNNEQFFFGGAYNRMIYDETRVLVAMFRCINTKFFNILLLKKKRVPKSELLFRLDRKSKK